VALSTLMGVTVVVGAELVGGVPNNFTLAPPAGALATDVLLLIAYRNPIAVSGVITPPAGWTVIENFGGSTDQFNVYRAAGNVAPGAVGVSEPNKPGIVLLLWYRSLTQAALMGPTSNSGASGTSPLDLGFAGGAPSNSDGVFFYGQNGKSPLFANALTYGAYDYSDAWLAVGRFFYSNGPGIPNQPGTPNPSTALWSAGAVLLTSSAPVGGVVPFIGQALLGQGGATSPMGLHARTTRQNPATFGFGPRTGRHLT
jgi:hypothetical protein